MQLPDSERIALGFELVRDLSTQLITLTAGIIALTVASAERGMLHLVSRRARLAVKIGWLCCWMSGMAGVLQILSLTGSLIPLGGVAAPVSNVPPMARQLMAIQIIMLSMGLLAFTVFAWQAFGRVAAPPDAAIRTSQQLRRELSVHPTAQTPEVPVAATTAAAVEPETGKAPAPDSRHGPETTPELNTRNAAAEG
ncbi:MAG TPA: hypothetical protein VFR37_20175 [Longimicrobium sp.]|nr:hypothetical protein [Longimicrobium sp.]